MSAVGVDGGVQRARPGPSGADGEVALDIEVVGAVAPGATRSCTSRPTTDQGFVDAISNAVHATPTPIAVSISWGQSEDSWTAQARSAMDAAFADAAALGVTVCVAAGDNGSSDGVTDAQPHVDFPASSPHALACGGTRLHGRPGHRRDQLGGRVERPRRTRARPAAGSATCSRCRPGRPTPGCRTSAGGGHTGRGVPDVAGNADPSTGYQVLVDGQSKVVGGTSAVAPLWAALVSRLAQAAGQPFGLIQPILYAGVPPGAAAPGFKDITSGNNGAYSAGPGWDACSGLGSPDGTALLTRLKG